jgi:eukaryotic-like serine/threonine-protein kinase
MPLPGGAPRAAITLDQVIRSRVASLSPGARRFLEIVAIAGRPVKFTVAKDAADPDPRENVVEVLRIHHLIRTRETEIREEIEAYHDRIREAVVAGLSAEQLKGHHRRLALALETSGSVDPESLALHWKEAEELDRAAEYAATAAGQAADALAFDRAARLYLMALDLAGRAEPATRRALRVSLADALANAGRGAEAASSYLAAAQGAPTAEGLEFQRRAAEQLVRTGHIDQGIPLLRSVLQRVGFRYPKTSVGSLLSFLFHRLRIRLRGLRFRERDASQIAPATLIRIDTCWSVSLGLSMIDTLRGRDFQGRHLLLALTAGEPYRIARAVANEAGYSATGGPPNARRTAELVVKATELAARVGHPQAIGVAQVAVGITAYAEGRWKAAWDLAQKGEAILRERCTGVTWELDTTHIYSLRGLFFLGEIAELCARLPTLLREARERDDLFAETSLRARHSYVAWLSVDQPAKARGEVREAIARWSSQAFYMQHYYALVAEADIALYTGEPDVAAQALSEKRRALQRSRLLRVHHLRIEWLHLCARSLVARAAQTVGSESDRLLREAESTARRIERERVHWGDALAALVRAGIAWSRGSREEAARRLAFAASIFAIADMALYAAVCRRRLGSILGGAKGRALVDSADAWMRDQKIQNPAGFAAMLAPGVWE